MRTYCNVRLSVLSGAQAISQTDRSRRIADWLAAHTDDEILVASKRGKPGVNDGTSVSTAISIPPDQTQRLSRLLDGRRHTLSALVRNIFAH